VVAVHFTPVSTLVMVSGRSGTTPPLESCAVPVMAPRFPCAKAFGATDGKRLRRKMAQIEAMVRIKEHPPKNSGKDLTYKESKRNDKARTTISKEKKTKVFVRP